ncbi:hypothetical protein ACG04R_06295 [Roseateles sp. BYS78W]|uniref:TonB C-terminal domain-containing protein n=1 Tax=Pelomonas candidula TaxID=3299025 RepID=A0ABW7H8P9_9BURK
MRLINLLRRAALAAVLLWQLAPVHAQDLSPAPDVRSKALLACLTTPGQPPQFSADEIQRENRATVRLSLRFTAPDAEPEVAVVRGDAPEDMVRRLQAFARLYRLPCLPTGEAPVLAVQEFLFDAHGLGPVHWSLTATQDPQVAAHAAALRQCVKRPERIYFLESDPGESINVLVRLVFRSAEAAPDVRLLYSTLPKAGRVDLLAYLKDYRLPCLPAGAEPFEVEQHFKFSGRDAATHFGREFPLRQFLGGVKGAQQLQADFDFNTMDCPFKVAWTLGKPAWDNSVGEIGEHNLNRAAFLDWLRGLELALQPDRFQNLLGSDLVINVPCGRLRLNQPPLKST